MGETQTFDVNDINRAIAQVMDSLKQFESDKCDGRVRALILTKLEEAQLWSLKLVKS
jgi:hypothetical protein